MTTMIDNQQEEFIVNLYKETSIDSVTVFNSRATLHRTFTLKNIKRGGVAVVVHAPAEFKEKVYESSLRLDVYNVKGVVMDQYLKQPVVSQLAKANQSQNGSDKLDRYTYWDKAKKSLKKKYTTNEYRALKDQLKKLQEQKTLLDKQLSNMESCKSSMNTMLFPRSTSCADPSVNLLSENSWKNLEQFLNSFSNQINSYDEQLDQIRRKLHILHSEIVQLKTKMEPLISSREKLLSDEFSQLFNGLHIGLVMEVEEETEAEAFFHIQYQIQNCYWNPLYDLRLEQSKLKIIYHAEIYQNTGEDWKNLKSLFLSTVDPNLSNGPNSIPSAILTLPGNQKTGFFSSVFGTDDARHLQQEVTAMKAVVNANDRHGAARAFTFSVDSIRSIPSGNSMHKVHLSTLEFNNIELSHHCVPKSTTDVYMRVKTVNTTEIPLVKGLVRMFDNNHFVGTQELKDSINPTEDIELFMGVDPGVTVQYKPVRRLYSEKDHAIFKLNVYKRCKVNRHIKVTNKKPYSVHLNVADQIPQSQEKNIRVDLIKPEKVQPKRKINLDKKNIVFMNELNHVEWRNMEIKPGESRDLPIEYLVEWPIHSNLNVQNF